MDFPKSVPSVGLVDGKFVDEDAVLGTPGSLIPAQWGNAVTEEILNVIETAGLTPDEALNTQLASAISAIIGTTRPLASQADAEAGSDNTKTMTALRTQQAINIRAAIIGSARNVRMSVQAASATATLTADEVVVKSALGGSVWLVSGLNKSINLATIGAGGMDVGAAPVNGWVAIYVIYNPASDTSALLCVNSTSAVAPEVCAGVMPAGYTASALVSVWGTTGSGLLKVATQLGRSVGFVSSTVVSLTSGQPAFTEANISNAVPPNANVVSGSLNGSSNTSTAITMQITPDGVIDVQQMTASNSVQSIGSFRDLKLTKTQSIFYRLVGATGPTYLVNISQYGF